MRFFSLKVLSVLKTKVVVQIQLTEFSDTLTVRSTETFSRFYQKKLIKINLIVYLLCFYMVFIFEFEFVNVQIYYKNTIYDSTYQYICKYLNFLVSAINSTSEAVVKILSNIDERPDVIYQKDASFSAVLDTYQDGLENNVNSSEAVRFIVNTSLSPTSDQIIMLANTSSSYYSSTTERLQKSDPVCSKSCGAGTCLLDTTEVDDSAIVNQRCQCVLGKTGVNCQAGK